MNRLFIFNPENDVNLAYGNNTPRLSPHVKSLINDGQLLPVWYADEDDQVIAENIPEKFADIISRDFSLEINPFDCNTKPLPSPWGWSIQLARNLRRQALSTPTDSQLDRIRQLSHRRASIFIANHLDAEPSVEVFSLPRLQEIIDKYGDAYVKAPWSSSGRGVFRVTSLQPDDIKRIKLIMTRQGSMLVERAYPGRQDFAMLFYAEGGKVGYRGLSLFSTNTSGGYMGNLVADDVDIIRILESKGADSKRLTELSQKLEDTLSKYIKEDYSGWLGVDMLLCDCGKIIPCIELNLRMTMGVVAHIFYRKWMIPGTQGLYTVKSFDKCNSANYTAENNRLCHGTLKLTPETPASQFEFSVTVVK